MSANYVENPGWDVVEGGARKRRSPVAWLSSLGIGLLSFFSGLTDDAAGAPSGKAQAESSLDEDVPIPDDKCCNLARLDRECKYTGDKSNFTCPDGFYKTFWPCCEGTQLIGCGECASGPSCLDPPWDCSIWWWMDGSC
jgi:hypothetical protein